MPYQVRETDAFPDFPDSGAYTPTLDLLAVPMRRSALKNDPLALLEIARSRTSSLRPPSSRQSSIAKYDDHDKGMQYPRLTSRNNSLFAKNTMEINRALEWINNDPLLTREQQKELIAIESNPNEFRESDQILTLKGRFAYNQMMQDKGHQIEKDVWVMGRPSHSGGRKMKRTRKRKSYGQRRRKCSYRRRKTVRGRKRKTRH